MTSSDEILFRDKQGRTLTRADLESPPPEAHWHPPEGQAVPEQAIAEHKAGIEHASNNRLDEAIASMEAAAALADYWPHPLYDAATVQMMRGDTESSIALLERVEVLAPLGFFATKTALWALRKERDRELPPGVYVHYSQICALQEPAQRGAAIQQLLGQVAAFAPAWKDLALLSGDPEACMQALQNGLAATPDADTEGMMLANMGLVFAARGDRQAAVDLIGTLALNPEMSSMTRITARQAFSKLLGPA